jgi:hypothetical protein
LGLHGLKPGFAWFQTQDKPEKSRFLLFDVYFAASLQKETKSARLEIPCLHFGVQMAPVA